MFLPCESVCLILWYNVVQVTAIGGGTTMGVVLRTLAGMCSACLSIDRYCQHDSITTVQHQVCRRVHLTKGGLQVDGCPFTLANIHFDTVMKFYRCIAEIKMKAEFEV